MKLSNPRLTQNTSSVACSLLTGTVQVNQAFPQVLDIINDKINIIQKRKVWIDWTVDNTSHYDPLYEIGKASKIEIDEQASVDLASEDINTTEL